MKGFELIEFRAEIKQRYESGETISFIARALDNRDHTTILYHVKAMGLLPRWSKAKRTGVDLPLCSIPFCGRTMKARTLCHKHYMNRRKYAEMELSYARGRTVEIMRPQFEGLPPVILPKCDHSSSRCECVNRGKANYQEYLRHANYKTV